MTQATLANRSSSLLLPGEKPPSVLMVRLIAGFALIKSLLFVVAALVAYHIMKHPDADAFKSLLGALHLEAKPIRSLLTEMLKTPKKDLAVATGVASFYSVLYMTEAIGLWLDKTWAEWLTVIGSFVPLPFELMYLYEKITWSASTLLIINIAVIIYLTRRLKFKRELHMRRQARRELTLKTADTSKVGD